MTCIVFVCGIHLESVACAQIVDRKTYLFTAQGESAGSLNFYKVIAAPRNVCYLDNTIGVSNKARCELCTISPVQVEDSTLKVFSGIVCACFYEPYRRKLFGVFSINDLHYFTIIPVYFKLDLLV